MNIENTTSGDKLRYGFWSFSFWEVRRVLNSSIWRNDVPVILCGPYFMLSFISLSSREAYFYVGLTWVTLLGFSGIPFVLSTLSLSRKEISGPVRPPVSLSSDISIRLSRILFSILTILPWLFFPKAGIGLFVLVLYAAIVVFGNFFHISSLPKRLGTLFMVDLTWVLLPLLLLTYTFATLAEVTPSIFAGFLVLFGLWLTIRVGRKLIISREYELEPGIQSRLPRSSFYWVFTKSDLLRKVIIGLEVLAYLGFLWFCIDLTPFLFWLFFFLGSWYWWNAMTLADEVGPETGNFSITMFLDGFYQVWMPLLILIAVVQNRVFFLPILVLHILVFPNFLRNAATSLCRKVIKLLPHRLQLLVCGQPLLPSLAVHIGLALGYSLLFYGMVDQFLSTVSTEHMIRMYQRFFTMIGFLILATHTSIYFTLITNNVKN